MGSVAGYPRYLLCVLILGYASLCGLAFSARERPLPGPPPAFPLPSYIHPISYWTLSYVASYISTLGDSLQQVMGPDRRS